MRTLLITLILMSNIGFSQSFKSKQEQYPRVRQARDNTNLLWKERFEEKGIAFPPKAIFLRAFKMDDEFEIWAKNDENKYELIHTFPICSRSGKLGPKREEGDMQVPEGFYFIDIFNPTSSFHLSMRVNYPNASDKKLSNKIQPGGDIYIHGDCVTIGCIPLTDEGIEQVYWLAVLAKNNGQPKIPIHIFPTRIKSKWLEVARSFLPDMSELVDFWEGLSDGYEYFEENRTLPLVKVDSKGGYYIQD